MKLNMDPRLLVSQASSKLPDQSRQRQEKEALKKTAQQFEAIFIRTMFKEMRATVPEDGLLPRGNAEAIFTDLQDMEAAQSFADRGGIGIAEMIYRQLLGPEADQE